MKKILFLGVVLFSFMATADIATDTVTLRTMDKITGRVQKINVVVGEQKKVGTLTVYVKKCLKKPPEETPENAAYLRIFQQENKIFSGWMFSSNPALSAMEDPVYDIWVVECISEKSENLEASEILNEQPADTVNESEIEDKSYR